MLVVLLLEVVCHYIQFDFYLFPANRCHFGCLTTRGGIKDQPDSDHVTCQSACAGGLHRCIRNSGVGLECS